jgi:hypothetical protein
VINSPEVCYATKKPYAEVSCKNIIIFSYKNHLCRFCRKGKQFYKKIYIITLYHFLVQDLGMTSYTTYPKIGHRSFIDFEISQI